MDKERKIEASVPVQSRVDLRTLATFAKYWESHGYMIDNMSRLISWTMDAFKEVLIKSRPDAENIETLEEACEILSSRSLMNRTMMKRAERKIHQARGLENIRLDGWEVNRDSCAYKELHPKNQVTPYPGIQRNISREDREELERILETDRQLQEAKMNKQFEQQRANAMKSDKLVSVEGESELAREHARKAKEMDEKIAADDMMPPGYKVDN